MEDPWRRQQPAGVFVLSKNKERTPSEIATYFDFTMPVLSTHLRVLRDAGPVDEHREGQSRYYSTGMVCLR
ncbi:MAG TPA: ArsR family transcriptional regulator [Nitrososphaera sp.]